MPTLFEYLDSINQSKMNLIKDEVDEKEYNIFMINRGLSFFADTVLLVNVLNKYEVSKKMHYGFLLNAIPAKKRFSKWHKADTESEDLKLLSEHYNCSFKKAKVYLSLLSQEQLEEIREYRKIGGKHE